MTVKTVAVLYHVYPAHTSVTVRLIHTDGRREDVWRLRPAVLPLTQEDMDRLGSEGALSRLLWQHLEQRTRDA